MKATSNRKLSLVHSSGERAPLQPALDSQGLARAFLDLAARAASGELVGAALVVWKGDETYEMQVSGLLKRDAIKAHYAASQLASTLLQSADERGWP